MALITVNEGTTLLLDLAWYDDADVAVTPSSASYRIDDDASGAAVLASTSITGLSTTNTIVVTHTQNLMVNAANATEERIVTLTWTYGASRQGTDEFRYLIKNLWDVS
jgi:hypothetical protein